MVAQTHEEQHEQNLSLQRGNTTLCENINVPKCQLLQPRGIPCHSACSVYRSVWPWAVTNNRGQFRNFNLSTCLTHSPSASYQTPVCPTARQLHITAASFLSLPFPSYPVMRSFPQVSVGARPPGHPSQSDGCRCSSHHLTGLSWLEWKISSWTTRDAGMCVCTSVGRKGKK